LLGLLTLSDFTPGGEACFHAGVAARVAFLEALSSDRLVAEAGQEKR
jgi:hypothetical protein